MPKKARSAGGERGRRSDLDAARETLVPRQDVEPPKLAVAETWWRIFTARVHDLDAAIPASAAGTIQFEVARDGAPPAFFHLALSPSSRTAHDGVAGGADVWVETSEAELEGMLERRRPEGALRAFGRVDLFKTVLACVSTTAASGSPLSVRLSR